MQTLARFQTIKNPQKQPNYSIIRTGINHSAHLGRAYDVASSIQIQRAVPDSHFCASAFFQRHDSWLLRIKEAERAIRWNLIQGIVRFDPKKRKTRFRWRDTGFRLVLKREIIFSLTWYRVSGVYDTGKKIDSVFSFRITKRRAFFSEWVSCAFKV